MLELKSCKICKKAFAAIGFLDKCPQCIEKDEDDYHKIRDYLYEHPCANIYEVSTVLSVSISKIKRYLREDRLEIVEQTNTFLTCEECGKPIRSGWYCDECRNMMKHDYKVTYIGKKAPNKENRINYVPSKNSPPRKVASR